MKIIATFLFFYIQNISTARDTIAYNTMLKSSFDFKENFESIKGIQNTHKTSETTFPPATKLLYFIGDSMEEYNHITWGAISERNHCCWVVMSSVDSVHWVSLDTVSSTHNTKVSQEYYYDDYYTSARFHYKLNSIDDYGNAQYSQWITLYRPHKDLTLEMYPNPTEGLLFIRYKYKIDAIEVYNPNGELQKSFNATNVNNIYQIDITDLEQGIYILKIKIGGEWRIWKVVKV
jgi:hypothetical protein